MDPRALDAEPLWSPYVDALGEHDDEPDPYAPSEEEKRWDDDPRALAAEICASAQVEIDATRAWLAEREAATARANFALIERTINTRTRVPIRTARAPRAARLTVRARTRNGSRRRAASRAGPDDGPGEPEPSLRRGRRARDLEALREGRRP